MKTKLVALAICGAASLQVSCMSSVAITDTDAPKIDVSRLYGPYAAYEIDEEATVLFDEPRNRSIPLRAFVPRTSQKRPLVIFSHGIGESRDSYRYFGRALAQHGYVVVHVQHAGTDRAVIEKGGWLGLYRETKNAMNWKNRVADVPAVLDAVASKRSGLRTTEARADLDQTAAVGHSAGAFTALAQVGMIVGESERLIDERVRAAVAISMPEMRVAGPNAYSAIATPVLHITGTRDYSLTFGTTPGDRRVPFDQTTAPHQYLATIRGATHSTFSNIWDARRESQTEKQGITVALTLAFLDAYLLGDKGANQWLSTAGKSLRDVALEMR